MSAAPLAFPEFVALGDVIAGKYRIDRLLGAGGMAHVFEARHLTLDERVAVKVLSPEMGGSVEAAARFLREARAAAKMRSEHAARVFDVGVHASGSSYMVMEFLQGRDLDQLLVERERLEVEEAVDFVLQACEALAEAHAAGVVHRDLKPANLFLTWRADASACVKVIDFGISKATHIVSEEEIITAESMGSPPYISPEQLQSAHDVDARTDIWSLGCCLYEMLAGAPPFAGEPLTTLWHQILDLPPPPLREKAPAVPEGLEAVVLRCLAKRREERFQDVAELASALAEFGPERAHISVSRVSGVMLASARAAGAPSSRRPFASGGRLAKPSDPIAEHPRAPQPPRESQPQVAPPTRRNSTGAWVAAGAVALVGGAALLWEPAASTVPTPPTPTHEALATAVESAPTAPPPPEVTATAAAAGPTSSAAPKKHEPKRSAPRPAEEGLFDDRK